MKMLVSLAFVLILFFLAMPTFAHCPLCTAATGTVATVTRVYGVDDLVVGTLIGAFTISTALWLNNILLKRNEGKNYIPYQLYLILMLTIVSTITGFYFFSTGSDLYKIFGIDKLLLGVVIGSFITLVGFGTHNILRKINKNKNYFPAQSILIVLILLFLINISFYLMGWL